MRATRFRRKIILSYLFAVLAAAAVMGLSALVRQPPSEARLLEKEWRLSAADREHGTFSVPFYVTGKSNREFSRGIYEAAVRFDLQTGYEQPVLVLPYTNANAIQARLNGTNLGTIGDMQRGRTSRWNTPHMFAIPEGTLEHSNQLTLRLYGLYEAGISAPPYIAEREAAAGHYLLLSHFNLYIIAYAFGSILLLALLFLLTSRSIDQGNRERVYLALALIGLALYLTDYLYLPTIGVPYHVYKRIALIGLYLSITLSIPGLYGYTHRPLDLPAYIAMSIPGISAVLIALLPQNTFEVRAIYTYANFSFLPAIAVLHHALLPRLRRDRRAFWILMGLTVLSILALRDVLVVLLGSTMPILTHYGIIFLEIAFSFALIGEMLEYYRRMVSLKQWADTVYQESMRDPLTGALNRKILDSLKRVDPESFSLIMLDLDDFKRINDCWGHATGDTVLKVIVETLVMNIRKTDYVVRLGGDEFMVILFSCDLATAEKTAGTLHNRITERCISHAGGELRMDCSMGVGEVESARELDSRMEEIDRLLYFAKRTGKGKVVSDRSSEIPSTILAE